MQGLFSFINGLFKILCEKIFILLLELCRTRRFC